MKKLIYLILTMSMAVASFAADPLSLEDALSLALQNNYNIKQVKNSTEIMEKTAIPGNAGLLPSVSLSAGVNYADNTISGMQTQSTTNTATLSAQYLLFDGFGNVYTYKKLKSQSEQAVVEEKSAIEGTLLVVAQSFLSTSLARDNMDAAKDQLDISQENFDKQKSKYDLGNLNKLNYLNAQVNLNADEITYMNAVQSYEEQKRALNVLLGRDPETELDVLAYSVAYNDYSISELAKEVFANNPTLISAEMDLDQSKLELKSARSDYWPTVALTGSYGYNQTESDLTVAMDNPNTSFSAGLNISWDLFTGRRNAQTQISKITLKNSELALDAEKLSLLENINNLYTAYENSLVVLDKQIQNLELAQLNFDQTKDYYDQGLVTSTQFREAQLNLTNSKISISQARNSAYMYDFQIMQISGKLLEQQ